MEVVGAVSEKNEFIRIVTEQLKAGDYKEAEQGCIQILRHSPLSAQVWVLLGESLMHQGLGGIAWKVFNRAWLLDPEALWVPSVKKALEGRPKGTFRQDIEELLAVDRVKVTAAILTKNEERCIERCLNSLLDAVDDIFVIDTGSTDATLDIVRRYSQVNIVAIEWINDFAAARNEGLRHVTGDWVLWIDADEYLHLEDEDSVRTAAGIFNRMNKIPTLNIGQINKDSQGRARTNYSMSRMFPLDRGIRYFGKVHEQLTVGENAGDTPDIVRIPVRIRCHHDGYTPDVLQQKEKLRRNITLLEDVVATDPDQPAWHFFLGREKLALGEREKALEHLLCAVSLGRGRKEFALMQDVFMHLVRVYLLQSEWTQAEEMCLEAIEHTPNFPDAHYYLAHARMQIAHELWKRAEQHVKDAKSYVGSYRGPVACDSDILTHKADLLRVDIAIRAGNLYGGAKILKSMSEKYPELKDIKVKNAFIKDQRNKLNTL